MQIKDLLDLLNKLAAFDLAETWDNVGLLVGNPDRDVSSILVGLDPTPDLLDEAKTKGADTIITHHPLIFHPLTALRTDQVAGKLIKKALAGNLTIIGCHTNLDVVPGGVNDKFAELLGLQGTKPLTGGDSDTGFGRIGTFLTPVPPEALFERLFEVLGIKAARIAGTLPESIKNLAVCGGSGSGLAEQAFKLGAQIYISSEIKHSTARWAEAVGFCIIDAGHYATENLIVPAIVATLNENIKQEGLQIDVQATSRQKDPFRHLFKNKDQYVFFENS